MSAKRRTFRLRHYGGNLGRIQVAASYVIVLHPYVDGAASQEEAHNINIDGPGGPKTEKGGVSNNSGRTKGNGAHLEGRNRLWHQFRGNAMV
jgi:hypothetical protein